VPFCTSCGHENPDDARFCAACGSPLAGGPAQPPREARKTVTVVFSDLAGSTSLGERLDPESIRRVMSRYFDEMSAVLLRHGGTVEKFIGDAIVAVFGVPVLHEDDALRAVRAAAEMRETLGQLNAELDRTWGVQIAVRTGVNTGEVVVGDPSAGQSLAFGDAMNVAARLEQNAGPGEILIGEPTYHLVRDAVEVEDVAALALKGKGEPVPARKLVAVRRDVPGHARRLDSPMVGREHERALLDEAYARAVRERASHLFTVLGSAGVGKSRLVREFLGKVEPHARVAAGRCLPYGEGITFWPLVEAIRSAAGLPEAVDESVDQIRRLLADEESADMIADGVAQLLGAVEFTSSPDELFWAVRKLFEALARQHTLVVVFDDIQWAEPMFLDLIEHIAGWSHDAPILLLCVARPELVDARPTWGGGRLNASTVLLEPLDDEDCELMMTNLLGKLSVPDAVKERINAAAEGNPLFVEEMVSMLVDDGLLRRQNGSWVVERDLSGVSVPPTIHALLAARLDRLGDEERELLERASVEGKVFHGGALRALSENGVAVQLSAPLMTLVRKELIGPERAAFAGEDAFRFRHILLRDAAYQALPKESRVELHKRFADWLERKVGERAHEYEEILGYHLEQAYRYSRELGLLKEDVTHLAHRSGGRLASAGRRAFARGDVSAAVSLLGRAVELLPDTPDRLELKLQLAEALRSAGELARAGAVLSESLKEAIARGDRRLEAHALVDGLLLKSLVDPDFETEELMNVAADTVSVLEELGDDLGLSKAWRGIAEVHLTKCRWGPTAEAVERALTHAERAGAANEIAVSLPLLANALFWGPTPVETGLRRLAEIREHAAGHRSVEASVLCVSGAFEAMRGHFDEGRRLVTQGRVLYEELGQTFSIAGHALLSSSVAMLAGEPAAAERELRPSCELLEAMGEKGILSSLAAFLAEALYAQGKLDEAERFTDVSEDAASPDDVASQIAWRSTRAKILARRGAFPQAESLARQALGFAEETDFLNMHADVLMALAEVLRLEDLDDEAGDSVQRALELYELKGNAPSAERARTALSALATGTA
jgi:class 3 adenylate cyclase/tetratricopeptide (TPR) repeat protein